MSIREITSAADLKDYLLGWDYQGTTEEQTWDRKPEETDSTTGDII